MDRVLLVAGGLMIAGLVAVVLGRRSSPPPTNVHTIPRHLDRSDFARPNVEWLIAVFTSASCDTCAGVWERARHLESDQVVVEELELGAAPRLHERYGIDAVPLLIIADASGEVRRAILGPTTTSELWATMAEVRESG